MNRRFMRNSTLIPQDKLKDIEVIGLGGTGSAVIMGASLMGFKHIKAWDNDIFSEHNGSTTLYPPDSVGQPKAKLAEQTCEKYGTPSYEMKQAHWTPEDGIGPRVIITVDDMEVRKEIYKIWKANNDRDWLIDLRMGALSYEVITVCKDNDNYMDYWKPSAEIQEEVCTAKHTIFTAFAVASAGLAQTHKMVIKTVYNEYVWCGLDMMQMITKKLTIPKQADVNIVS